jgi:hypothetical protein
VVLIVFSNSMRDPSAVFKVKATRSQTRGVKHIWSRISLFNAGIFQHSDAVNRIPSALFVPGDCLSNTEGIKRRDCHTYGVILQHDSSQPCTIFDVQIYSAGLTTFGLAKQYYKCDNH